MFRPIRAIRNPDKLDPEIAAEVVRAVQKHRDRLLPDLPASIRHTGKLLGTGHYGMVWATADPCWVFKATTDPWEAAFAVVQRSGEVDLEPGLGVVYYSFVQYVKDLPGCRRPLFVIVRSAVEASGFLTQYMREAQDLMQFKTLTEEITLVISSLSARKRKVFIEHLFEYEYAVESEKDDYDERHNDLHKIAYSEDIDFESSSDESRLRSFHLRGDPEPELTLATAGKLVLAKTIAAENASRGFHGRYPDADVWKVLNEYIQANVLLADVHLGNIGKYTPQCLPEGACCPDGWIISDPGHGVALDDSLESIPKPRPFEVLIA